ncbi:MAG: hypothetical protein JKY65_09440 [Planctomycetes bacterium]|nr:hypothetical protein [Planctomycetota bacterium]
MIQSAHRTRLGLGFGAALLGLLIGTCVAEAGVVVLKNGHVIVGRVSTPADSTDIQVSWPYGSQRKRGKIVIKAEDMRWHDATVDVLSDDYFDRFEKEPLVGALWLRMLEEYRIRKEQAKADWDTPLVLPKSLDPLEFPAAQGPGFKLRKPRGWSASIQDKILVFEAPKEGGRGFRPRIHAFVVAGVADSPKTQVKWVQAELGRIRAATAGRAEFQLLGSVQLGSGTLSNSTQAQFESETRHKDRRVRAIRRLVFRSGKTYVLCAYADAPDFDAHRGLFESCLDSLEP